MNESIWEDCITPKDGGRLDRVEIHIIRAGNVNLNRGRKSREVTTLLVVLGL